MSNLCDDIIYEITKWLPMNDYLHVRLVWHNIIGDMVPQHMMYIKFAIEHKSLDVLKRYIKYPEIANLFSDVVEDTNYIKISCDTIGIRALQGLLEIHVNDFITIYHKDSYVYTCIKTIKKSTIAWNKIFLGFKLDKLCLYTRYDITTDEYDLSLLIQKKRRKNERSVIIYNNEYHYKNGDEIDYFDHDSDSDRNSDSGSDSDSDSDSE
jgi:hypothetical protein